MHLPAPRLSYRTLNRFWAAEGRNFACHAGRGWSRGKLRVRAPWFFIFPVVPDSFWRAKRLQPKVCPYIPLTHAKDDGKTGPFAIGSTGKLSEKFKENRAAVEENRLERPDKLGDLLSSALRLSSLPERHGSGTER